jgi:hypothetical protein
MTVKINHDTGDISVVGGGGPTIGGKGVKDRTVWEVADEAAMLATSAEVGDQAIRADLNEAIYIFKGPDDPSNISQWKRGGREIRIQTVTSTVNMIALNGLIAGDQAVNQEDGKTYVFNGGTAGDISDWTATAQPPTPATPAPTVTTGLADIPAIEAIVNPNQGDQAALVDGTVYVHNGGSAGNINDWTLTVNAPVDWTADTGSSIDPNNITGYISTAEKDAPGGVASLDAESKVAGAALPAAALTNTYNVANLTERDALIGGGSPAAEEITDITFKVGAQIAPGDYFAIGTPEGDYYFWFEVDGSSGNDPSLAGRTGYAVAITSGDSARTVAGKVVAVATNPGSAPISSEITATNGGGGLSTVTFTCLTVGDVTPNASASGSGGATPLAAAVEQHLYSFQVAEIKLKASLRLIRLIL